MTQVAIINAAKKAIQQGKLQYVITLLKSDDEKPSSDTVREILTFAVNNAQWGLALAICSLDIENKLDDEALLFALQRTFDYNQLKIFQAICRQSVRPVSQAVIERILNQLLRSQDEKVWSYIEYLCLLPSANKPGQLLIDDALRKAASSGKWDLAVNLCRIGGDNKPSDPAIAAALANFWEYDRRKGFVAICAESTTPLSQKTIESLLNKAIASSEEKAWIYIRYLCLSPHIKNKAGQALIDRALRKAADRGERTLVLELCRIGGDNGPSEPAIAQALGKLWEYDQYEEFVAICTESIPPLSQETIESLLNRAIASHQEKAWKYIRYLCLSPLRNKPGQPLINNALIKASNLGEWALAVSLCTIQCANMPSDQAIEVALTNLWEFDRHKEFAEICEKSTTILSQATIESLLTKAIASSEEKAWFYIRYLCLSPLRNKPRQPLINEALIKASRLGKWALAVSLCTRGANTPSEPAIAEALITLWEYNRGEEFAAICKMSTTPPSQATIESLLNRAIVSHEEKGWSYIRYLCLSPNIRNKPRQQLIDRALEKVADWAQWKLAKELYAMEGNNRPGQAAIEHLLQQAANRGKLQIVKDLLAFPVDRRPRIEVVSNAFVSAAGSGGLSIVRYIYEGVNQPSRQTCMDAFLAAASKNQVEIIRYFLLKGPSEHLIVQSLFAAAKSDSLNVVKLLLSQENPIAIARVTIEQAFIESFVSGGVVLAEYFLDSKNEFNFEQSLIDDALLGLVEKPNYMSLTMIRVLFQFRRPSPAAIERALEKARAGNNGLIITALQKAAGVETSSAMPTGSPQSASSSSQTKVQSTAQPHRVQNPPQTAISEPKFYTIFKNSYQPTKDFIEGQKCDSRARRMTTISNFMTELRVSREIAEEDFSCAYDLWLESRGNETEKDQIEKAKKNLNTIIQDLCTLDGKVGWVGGETIKIGKNKKILIANGAAAIFKHYQAYKFGVEPSALAALNLIINQARQSDKYQGHWFFNRRHEDVSRFYKKIMELEPKISGQREEKQETSCCIL